MSCAESGNQGGDGGNVCGSDGVATIGNVFRWARTMKGIKLAFETVGVLFFKYV